MKSTKTRVRRPLLTKLISLYSLLTVIVVAVITSVVFFAQVDTIGENFVNSMKVKVYLLNDYIVSNQDNPNIFNLIEKKLEENNFERYAILHDTYLKPALEKGNIGSTSADTRMTQLAVNRLSFGGEFFTFYIENDTLFSYLPFTTQRGIFVLKIVEEFVEIKNTLFTIYRNSLLVGIIILVINMIFAFWVYGIFFSRINKIELAAKKVRKGDYSVRIKDHKKDELSLVVSVMNDMVRTVEVSVSEAKGMNPLSGLPGNISIEKEVDKRIEAGDMFAILYSDLDNFKAYNDKYGFSKGDEILLYARDCFIEAKAEFPYSDIFLGHEGGDDFIAVAPYGISEKLAQKICEVFDAGVKRFYTEEDAEQGFIISKDRQGNEQQFNLASFSIAILHNKDKKVSKLGELDVGTMKSAVKKMEDRPPGSAYLMDRRKGDRDDNR
jgi:GGDEF domain-containing protein